MKRKLTITISGVTASGKTTLAAFLAEKLRESGAEVTIKDDSTLSTVASKRVYAPSVLAETDIQIVTTNVNKEPT